MKYPRFIDYPADPILRARIIKRFKKITQKPEFKKSVALIEKVLTR